MNLGGVFLNTFLYIVAASFAVAVALAAPLIWVRRKPLWRGIALALIIWPFVSLGALFLFHHPVFVAWHRWQNPFVPQTGCVSYEPTFNRLCAKYRMSRQTFAQWVKDHPWKLKQSDSVTLGYDREPLGIESAEAAYDTVPAENGKQLRVYYKDGMMYLAYYAW